MALCSGHIPKDDQAHDRPGSHCSHQSASALDSIYDLFNFGELKSRLTHHRPHYDGYRRAMAHGHGPYMTYPKLWPHSFAHSESSKAHVAWHPDAELILPSDASKVQEQGQGSAGGGGAAGP